MNLKTQLTQRYYNPLITNLDVDQCLERYRENPDDPVLFNAPVYGREDIPRHYWPLAQSREEYIERLARITDYLLQWRVRPFIMSVLVIFVFYTSLALGGLFL